MDWQTRAVQAQAPAWVQGQTHCVTQRLRKTVEQSPEIEGQFTLPFTGRVEAAQALAVVIEEEEHRPVKGESLLTYEGRQESGRDRP
jgi:hypothetical protein